MRFLEVPPLERDRVSKSSATRFIDLHQ